MPRRPLNDLSHSELQNILDKWFSRFIRLRDANDDGVIRCCTCGRFKIWNRGVDNGHYSKRNKAHRYTEKNCHAQCKYCNDRMKGEADKHASYIDKLYGEGTAVSLRETENLRRDLSRTDLIGMIEHYKKEAKRIAKEKMIVI